MDDPRQPGNGRGKEERVQCARDAERARRNSVCDGSTSPIITRTMSQEQVSESLQPDGSREMSGMTMDYGPSALTSLSTSPPQTSQTESPTMPPITAAAESFDNHIRHDIRALIQQKLMSGGSDLVDAFDNADEKPPISLESLAELDMPRIINNPKLRHDVNFDRELHFRPNFDGSKGRQKLQQSDHYWQALVAELCVLNYALTQRLLNPNREAYWARISRAAVTRLPVIFTAIRDILKTLVPDCDQKAVKERLDVDHIMQQILNGVCNLIDLANWLSKVLKSHCAPMRDAAVDNMRTKITDGAQQNAPEKLVEGLRQLLSILEAMKLDVANHQIRHMRPLLVDDTINFQRKYNAHRMSVGKLSMAHAREWISENLQPFTSESMPILALTRGLICDLLLKDAASCCPATFYLDIDRLRGLRTEMHNQVYNRICCDILNEFASLELSKKQVLDACLELTTFMAGLFRASGKFAEKSGHIAVEIERRLNAIEGRHTTNADLVNCIEQRLRDCLGLESDEFRVHATDFAERLISKVQNSVQEHFRMSAIRLQDVLVPQPVHQKQSTIGFGAHCEPAPAAAAAFAGGGHADYVRRLTHILCLHWQVWSELVYLTDVQDKDEDSASDNESDGIVVQSRAGSPTVPIATAVFAPGHKWLPVRVTVTDVPAGLPTPSPTPDPEEDSSGNTNNSNNEPSEDNLDTPHQQRA